MPLASNGAIYDTSSLEIIVPSDSCKVKVVCVDNVAVLDHMYLILIVPLPGPYPPTPILPYSLDFLQFIARFSFGVGIIVMHRAPPNIHVLFSQGRTI